MLVFEEKEKPENPEKDLSDQGRELTTNVAHFIMASTQGFEHDPHGWRRVLSPLRDLSSSKTRAVILSQKLAVCFYIWCLNVTTFKIKLFYRLSVTLTFTPRPFESRWADAVIFQTYGRQGHVIINVLISTLVPVIIRVLAGTSIEAWLIDTWMGYWWFKSRHTIVSGWKYFSWSPQGPV